MRRLLFSALLLCSLAGCDSHSSMTYLMTHPKALNAHLEHCQQHPPESAAEKKTCETAMLAGQQLQPFMAMEQAEPERFGMSVMEVQSEMVQLLIQLEQALHVLDARKAEHANAAALQEAVDRVEGLRKAYSIAKYHLAIYYGILALGSPE